MPRSSRQSKKPKGKQEREEQGKQKQRKKKIPESTQNSDSLKPSNE